MFAGEGEEEDSMDKKPAGRTSSVPPKGSGTDSKKADNGGGSRYAKYNRRRDPNNVHARQGEYSQSSRRPQPQRSKQAYDKRPRTRGYYNDGASCEVTKEPRAELGSALRQGSKKGNLNHLLNFTFAPREHTWGGGPSWKGRNKWGYKCTTRYNKEQFLQANCQFVVKSGVDYLLHSVDPDVLVDWEHVEQVRIFSHEVPSCPICLYPPTVAKITCCGHIFCLPCILHYLSLGDKTWRKCPICYDAIHQKDLKSVIARETHSYHAGEEITMKLMKRERGSTYAMTRSQWTARDGKPHNVQDAVDTCYVKLLLADLDQVQEIVTTEKEILEQQFKEEKDSLEREFIQAALDLVKERQESLAMKQKVKKQLAGALDSPSTGDQENQKQEIAEKPSVEIQAACEEVVEYASAFSDEEMDKPTPSPDTEDHPARVLSEEDIEKSDTAEGSEETEDCARGSPLEATGELQAVAARVENEGRKGKSTARLQPTDVYYFYQAEDGQHIYLHSLNSRCLVREYGGWENCPDIITAKIIDLQGFTMDEDLRKRMRYLNHLPSTCEFRVAELALKPPLLSKDTIRYFIDEIDRRRQARQRKSRDEKKKLKKMQEAEQRKMGRFPDMRMNLSSSRHFPSAQPGSYVNDVLCEPEATTPPGSSASSTPVLTPCGSPPGLNPQAVEFVPGSPRSRVNEEETQLSSTPSFAQMLREGKTRVAEAWPRATAAEQAVSRTVKKGSDSEDSDSEDRVPVPVFQASFGDAIQEALDNFDRSTESAAKEESEAPSSGGGRKKKGRKKLLFTTFMARTK